MKKRVSHSGIAVNSKMGLRAESRKLVMLMVSQEGRAQNKGDMPDKTRYPDFGRYLASARKALGFDTQKAFAVHLNIKLQTYGNWERGRNSPDPDNLAILDEAGINVIYLIRGTGPMLNENASKKIVRIA